MGTVLCCVCESVSRAGPGRINFRQLRTFPTIVSAGGTGLSVAKVKEGLARRLLAAEQNM